MPALLMALLMTQTPAPSDAKIIDLKDGYVRVDAPTYTIEVPKGLKVTEETPWGQRKASGRGGELGVMTAPPGQQSWESLYRTSLYFIQREEAGKATPYEIKKGEDGLEACTFKIINKDGFATRRYVLVKHPEKGLLALSVRIPDQKAEKEWAAHFDRMVKTAKFK